MGAALVAVVLLAISPVAHAADQAVARGTWSMVPQSKDANGDGVIDGDGGVPRSGAVSRQPSPDIVGAGNRRAQPHERLIDGRLSWYLDGDGFPVRLDACASTGREFRWSVTSAAGRVLRNEWRALGRRGCAQTVRLPEARYTLTLEVRDGVRRDVSTQAMEVRNLLILALGDSYASGEGNPRNVLSWLRRGGDLTPYWDDDGCHRSARGAPALAARALESASDRTSVTLVYLACSGASVDAGLLGPQPDAGVPTSQIEQAVAVLGRRPVDLVLLSIGGNDVGFGSVLEACLLNSPCPLARPGHGPLAGSPTVHAGVQAQTARLAGSLDRIAACLGDGPCRAANGREMTGVTLAPSARILPTLYPDITRATSGGACSYLTIPSKDFAWARTTILTPAPPARYAYPVTPSRTQDLSVSSGSLNQQVAATTRLPGWAPVTGTWSASGDSAVGHGVCAGADAWVFGLTALSALPSASFHPNPAGQQVLADAIADAAAAAAASSTTTG